MQKSVYTQVVSLNERVKEQAKLANEKRLVVLEKKRKLNQFADDLANMQKVVGEFNEKWFADFRGCGFNGRRDALEKEIEEAQKDYNEQTERTHILVTQKNQDAANAYVAKKQELENLEIERQNLEQKIASKKLVLQKCCEMSCAPNPLLYLQ